MSLYIINTIFSLFLPLINTNLNILIQQFSGVKMQIKGNIGGHITLVKYHSIIMEN